MSRNSSNREVNVWTLHWIFKSQQIRNSRSWREISTSQKEFHPNLNHLEWIALRTTLFTTEWRKINDQLSPLASAKLHRPVWVPIMQSRFHTAIFVRLSWHATGQWRGRLKWKGFLQVFSWEEVGAIKYLDNILGEKTSSNFPGNRAEAAEWMMKPQEGFGCGFM